MSVIIHSFLNISRVDLSNSKRYQKKTPRVNEEDEISTFGIKSSARIKAPGAGGGLKETSYPPDLHSSPSFKRH